MDEDEFAEIERRVHDLRSHYPNSRESVQLHALLVRTSKTPRIRNGTEAR